MLLNVDFCSLFRCWSLLKEQNADLFMPSLADSRDNCGCFTPKHALQLPVVAAILVNAKKVPLSALSV